METEALRHVAIYGAHDKKSKRWELAGTEKQLRPAIKLAVEHPPRSRFPRNPFPNVVLGDWNDDIVYIDFDEMSLVDVKRWSKILSVRYRLDGFIILRSSVKTHRIKDQELEKTVFEYKTKSYHVVFNRAVSTVELNRILAWLCLEVKKESLTKWFLMQLQKGTFTLRLGFKGNKKPPKIVYRCGNQDKQVAKFLANRRFIHSFLIQN